MAEWSNQKECIVKLWENNFAFKSKSLKLTVLKWIAILSIQGLLWAGKCKNYIAFSDGICLNRIPFEKIFFCKLSESAKSLQKMASKDNVKSTDIYTFTLSLTH